MLAASVLLFYTGALESTLRTISGALVGVLVVVAARVVPDALATSSRRAVGIALVVSTATMLALEALLLV